MKKISNNSSLLSSLRFRILNLFRISNFEFRILPKRGFSLVEALFYVVILSLALLAVMQTLIIVTRSHGVLRSAERIEQEAGIAMEQMIREIRDSGDIDDAGSMFNAHPGKLLLHSTTVSGLPRTVEFSLDGGRLSLKENGAVTGLLTSGQTSISDLVFFKINTARSKGVKIEMTVQSGTSTATRSESFYSTAVLRDSY